MKREGVTESPAGRWTRPEDYLGAMARKRTYRRKQPRRARTEPETPRLLLSTVPFLALFALLGVLALGIMIAAFPGFQPQAKAPQLAPREQGVATRGWFQEAQKDFHR
jgi:anti-sigma factor RsiW